MKTIVETTIRKSPGRIWYKGRLTYKSNLSNTIYVYFQADSKEKVQEMIDKFITQNKLNNGEENSKAD